MKCPKRGEVFTCEMDDGKYMSVVDKITDTIRCISSKTKKQTVRSRKLVNHVYTAEESQAMIKEFF